VLLVQRGRVLFEVAQEPCQARLGHAHDAVGGARVSYRVNDACDSDELLAQSTRRANCAVRCP